MNTELNAEKEWARDTEKSLSNLLWESWVLKMRKKAFKSMRSYFADVLPLFTLLKKKKLDVEIVDRICEKGTWASS